MSESLFSRIRTRPGKLTAYAFLGSALLLLIALTRYLQTGLLDTGVIVSGWDTPFYAWHARVILDYGPFDFMARESYPHLYTQTVAAFGYFFGSVTLAEKTFPLILGTLLVFANGLIVYRVSNDVHLAGLSALLTPATVGSLHLVVGGLHRNLMAYVLVMSATILLSKSENVGRKRYFIITSLLFFASAGTQFETFAVSSLALVLSALLLGDIKKLLFFLSNAIGATSLLTLTFPDFLDRYYLKSVQNSYSIQTDVGYDQLVFWSVGLWVLLPVAAVGLVEAFRLSRQKKTKEAPLAAFVFCFSGLLLVISLTLVNTSYDTFAGRAALVFPVPIILALGTYGIAKMMQRFVSSASQRVPLGSIPKAKIRPMLVTGFLLSMAIFASLTYTSTQALSFFSGPFLNHSGYEKIVAVRSYLGGDQNAPIFMFHGSSLWNADQYRAYLGIEIGEHLAYFGDVENMINLRPTEFSYPSPGREIADFTSVKYLRDMLGYKGYLIFPQKSYVRNADDLRHHPLAFISPELWDAPIPFYLRKFKVAEGIYVVPSLAEIEPLVLPKMRLETDRGTAEIVGRVVDADMVSVQMGSASTWYRLTGYPSCFSFVRLEQGGDMVHPESEPRRFDEKDAIIGNDPAENLQYWHPVDSVFAANLTLEDSFKKEGNSALWVDGNTDPWGNLMITFNPPYSMNLSGYDTTSFWSFQTQTQITWGLALGDATGRWAVYAPRSDSKGPVEGWSHLIFDLDTPLTVDPEFNIGQVVQVRIDAVLGLSGIAVSFSVDDLAVDTSPILSQLIYKARVLPEEELVAYFSTVGRFC